MWKPEIIIPLILGLATAAVGFGMWEGKVNGLEEQIKGKASIDQLDTVKVMVQAVASDVSDIKDSVKQIQALLLNHAN